MSEQTARHNTNPNAHKALAPRAREKEMNPIVEVSLFIVITLIALVGTLYTLAKENLFFTFLESGNIKYIRRGETVVRIIADIEGEIVYYNKGWKSLSVTILSRALGMYWIGLPPIGNVLKFEVSRKKELEEPTGRPPKEWIQTLEPKMVDSLRHAFPRPILIEKAELGAEDRQTVDVLAIGKFLVVNPYIPVVQLKGDFWELLSGLFRAAVLDLIERTGTIDKFIERDKSDKSGSLLHELWEEGSEFNRVLTEKTGLKLVGAAIPQWDPSDEATRKAMQARFLAEKDREAKIVEADAYAQVVRTKTEADAAAQLKLAEVRGIRVRETAAGLASTNASADEVTRATAAILRAEAHAGPDSKITTLVDGGGASPVIPAGDKK